MRRQLLKRIVHVSLLFLIILQLIRCNGAKSEKPAKFLRPAGDFDHYLAEEPEQSPSNPTVKLGDLIELLPKVKKDLKPGMSFSSISKTLKMHPAIRNYSYKEGHKKGLTCSGVKKEFIYDYVVIYQDNSGAKVKKMKNVTESFIDETLVLIFYFLNGSLIHFTSTHMIHTREDSLPGSLSNFCYLNRKHEKDDFDHAQDSILIYHIENKDIYHSKGFNKKYLEFIEPMLGTLSSKKYFEENLGECRVSFDYSEEVPAISCKKPKYNKSLSDLISFSKTNGGFFLYSWDSNEKFLLEKLSDSNIRITLQQSEAND